MPEPSAPARAVLVLARYRGPVEERLIREWIAANLDEPGRRTAHMLPLPRPGETSAAAAQLAERLAGASPQTEVLAARITWLSPHQADEDRPPRVRDLLMPASLGDRRSVRRQAAIAAHEPERARVVAGNPATVATLRERYAETHAGRSGSADAFARFVARRGHLSLERAERRVLGPQFKAPRLLTEEILAQPKFHAGLAALAEDVGSHRADLAEAEDMLDELATGWGRTSVELLPRIWRLILERGFDPVIDVVPDEIARLRQTTATKPVIFLWSHRSNLDSGVFLTTLHENGFPLPHLFAGINMSFGPMGVFLRRAGFIFIRRSFADNPLYKYVLREFIGYLAEKRFNLSWSIEGTRSRTGKMLPPKLGLLSYSVDAYLTGRTDDVALQPVSIAFDQLHEIGEYADYARGAKKAPEGMSWLYNFVKAQGARHYGKVYVRFPEPVSMRELLGPPNGPTATDPAARRLATHKMAFEVAWRINQATPVTPTALVTTLLLGSRGMALTSVQIHHALDAVVAYLRRADVPRAASVESLQTVVGVEATLRALATGGGPVTRVDGARDVVWLIDQKDQLAATFYRNSLVHVFLIGAICEIAIVLAGRDEPAGPARTQSFWDHAERLRDLLKFEFYFQDKTRFRQAVAADMAAVGEDWEAILASERFSAGSMLRDRPLIVSPFGLRSFVEAYEIVADVLVHHDQPGPIERPAIVKEAIALGDQFLAQKRISSAEPVSALLFETALQVAESRGVLDDRADRRPRALALRRELEAILAAIDYAQRIAELAFLEALRPERCRPQA